MGKCKTCEYYQAGTDIEWQESICACPKIVDMSSTLYVEDVEDFLDVTKDAAVLTDGDNYKAYFFVGPDFGCIHHKKKETIHA